MSKQSIVIVILLIAVTATGTWAVRSSLDTHTGPVVGDAPDAGPADDDRLDDVVAAVDGLSADVSDLTDAVADLADTLASTPTPVETPLPADTTPSPDPTDPVVTPAALDCSPYYEGGAVGCVTADGTPVCGAATNDGAPCAIEVVCPDDPHWCWTNCASTHYPRDQWYAEIRAGIRDRGCPDRYADGDRQCTPPTSPGAGLYIDGYYVSDTC